MTNFYRRFRGKEFGVKFLLGVGAFSHLLTVATVFLAGRLGVFPRYLQGNGILAGDPAAYIAECADLSRKLSGGDFGFLLSAGEQLHIRLYTISYAVLSPLFGENIFAFELVNLPVAIGIIYSLYRVGEIYFDRGVGAAAALIVNFLPSFQLHATQPLRDALFIFFFLSVFLILGRLLAKPLNFSAALKFTLLGAAGFLLLWFSRNGMFPIYLAVAGTALFLLLFSRSREARAFKFNFASLSAIIVFLLATPSLFAGWMSEKQFYPLKSRQKIDKYGQNQLDDGLPLYIIRVNVMRYEFNHFYAQAGSNIDREVYFHSPADLIAYLPRAALIGAFAPFPHMWASEGRSFGRAGRIVAGGETLFIYLFAVFAVTAVFLNYRSAHLMLVLLSFVAGATALGLVVTNLGALYRMRYFFWFLLILLGAEGVSKMARKFGSPSEDQKAGVA